MASFTDNQPPRFNPYIQQLPVEAMVSVGVQKQKAYEEGVQKIQTQIDNIAGLDVIRDVDKAYLQSKMNQLGNKLKGVASADFSNFQMVNSVSGMTKQIVRDKGVQNAVYSTAKYRKELTNMEEARKAGKSSVSNEWVFGKDSSGWLNSSDINESFNVKYTPYVDVQKKWMDVMKGLHSDLRETDIPYEKNADGSINYGKTAAAMQRLSKESVSSGKIANALSASLTPDEMNQLTVDGRYTFRQYDTPQSMLGYSNEKYSKLINDNNARIRDLKGLAALSTSNSVIKKQAEDAISSLTSQNSAYQQNYNDEVASIQANPEAAKGMIYKNGAIAQFAAANSWEHNKANLLSNPVLEAEHWEKNYSLDKSKFALSVRAQNWNEYKGRHDMLLADKNYDLAFRKQQFELYGTDAPFEGYGGKSTLIKDPVSAIYDEAKMYNDATDAGIKAMVKAVPGTSETQIKAALDKYQAGDPNWFKLGGSSKNIIPIEARELADQVISNRKSATRLNATIKQKTDEIENSKEFKQVSSKIMSSISDIPNLTVNADGNRIAFSKKEIVDYLKKKEAGRILVSETFRMTSSTDESGKRGAPPLTAKEKLLARIDNGKSPTLETYRKRIVPEIAKMNQIRNIKINEVFKDITGSYIPRQTTITFGSGEGNYARRNWEGIVGTALASYGDVLNEAGAVGAHDKLSEANIKKGKEWISSKERDNIVYSKVEQGDNTYLVMLKGGEEVMVPLTPDQASKIPHHDPKAPNALTKSIVKAQYLGNGNTNPTGKFADCMFDNTNIKGTRLNVGADLKWNKSDTNKQYISLQLNTPEGPVTSTVEYPVSREQGVRVIQSLNDADIKQQFLSDPTIDPQIKQMIKGL